MHIAKGLTIGALALVTALTAVPCRLAWAKAGTAASTSWSRRSPAERRVAAGEAEAAGSADMLDSLVSGR